MIDTHESGTSSVEDIPVLGVHFVEAGEDAGVLVQDVQLIWQQVIRHLTGSDCSIEAALDSSATYGQLKELGDADTWPIKSLTEDDWETFRKIASTFTDALALSADEIDSSLERLEFSTD